jgi:2',3'-cyclic-nucleotide 2'-phosphodiesterase (5'-nucleotidase family)
MPSKVGALEFTDPVVETSACVKELRETVDAIVLLAHQGLPGPMQTDAENDPEVQRPLDEDLAFCAAVPGIDVYIAAHSHHGLEQPIVHPDTRTLITQTYGYGTRLGRIRLSVKDRKVVRHGHPVDDHRRYRVATNSFLAEGGDGYGAFRKGTVAARDVVLNEMFAEHIKRVNVVSPPALGRLTDVNSSPSKSSR